MSRLRLGRAALATFLGYVTIAVATMVTTLLVDALFPDSFDDEELRYVAPWGAVMLALGVLFAVAGGYVAAWIARGSELPPTIALAGLNIAMWILYVLTAPEEVDPWYQLMIHLAGVVGIFVGCVLRIVQRVRADAD